MAPITASIEIARSPEEVFAYLNDFTRHSEWQSSLEEVTVETQGPVGVGTRVRERRKVPGGVREMTIETTEHDPPRRIGFRGLDGPIRAVGAATVSPAGEGSRVSVELDFEGHGLGRLLVPLVRSQARREVPLDQQRLKERLEAQPA
jgi:uncharacterized protein YndB with AHSA1/START domain